MCAIAVACGNTNGDALFGDGTHPGGGAVNFSPQNGGVTNTGGEMPPPPVGGTSNGGAIVQGTGGFGSGPAAGGAPSGGTLAAGGAPPTGGVVSSGGVAGVGAAIGSGGKGTGGAAPTCTDQAKNGKETAVDCGGGTCPACATGSTCAVATDCQSLVCQLNLIGLTRTCRNAGCGDNVKNGTETDLDCGGAQCAACGTGKRCLGDSDCASKVCTSGTCTCKKLTCADIAGACGPGVSDGCGGTLTCPACSTLCSDSKKDGNETAVDCGGPDCKACSDNSPCLMARDCQSGVCRAASTGAALTCRPAVCNDKLKNGTETDVDCGGGTCTGCAPGLICKIDGDCLKGPCNSGKCGCTPITCDQLQLACGTFPDGCTSTITCDSCAGLCSDNAQDGKETDVDCGGPDCPPCAAGLRCQQPADCVSGSCTESGGSGLICGDLPP